MRTFLGRLHMPNTFCGTAAIDVYASPDFPQCVLATIILVVGVAGDGRAKARAECEMLPPLCSVVIRTLVGARSDLKLQEQKP